MTEKPCARVAAWFSGDPVRIQVRTPPSLGSASGDGDVLDRRLGLARGLEPAEGVVDERAQREEELPHDRDEPLRELRRDRRAERLERGEQLGELRRLGCLVLGAL